MSGRIQGSNNSPNSWRLGDIGVLDEHVTSSRPLVFVMDLTMLEPFGLLCLCIVYLVEPSVHRQLTPSEAIEMALKTDGYVFCTAAPVQ